MPHLRPAPERTLGLAFRDPALRELALTPPSAGLPEHNQRLEFLGDALLNAAVAVLVHQEHPDWNEGELSKLRGMLVRREALSDWAREAGLELRQGPRSPRRPAAGAVDKALADALEAVLGALYLDVQAGGGDGFQAVRTAVEARFLAQVRSARPGVWAWQDSKTTLQERVAALGWGPPTYAVLARRGPDHAPAFRVRAEAGALAAEAEAGTIKAAEAEAARVLLEHLPSPLSSPRKLG